MKNKKSNMISFATVMLIVELLICYRMVDTTNTFLVIIPLVAAVVCILQFAVTVWFWWSRSRLVENKGKDTNNTTKKSDNNFFNFEKSISFCKKLFKFISSIK